MHIHIPNRFRTLTALSFFLIIIVSIYIYNNSGSKADYDKITGRVIYLSERMGNLPVRDLGKYRYLKIESYPYPFEIYADNQAAKIDKLKTGDNITVYFYETASTTEDKINRYLQYLEKDNQIVFNAGTLQITIGLVLIGLLIISIIVYYILYKSRRIPY